MVTIAGPSEDTKTRSGLHLPHVFFTHKPGFICDFDPRAFENGKARSSFSEFSKRHEFLQMGTRDGGKMRKAMHAIWESSDSMSDHYREKTGDIVCRVSSCRPPFPPPCRPHVIGNSFAFGSPTFCNFPSRQDGSTRLRRGIDEASGGNKSSIGLDGHDRKNPHLVFLSS